MITVSYSQNGCYINYEDGHDDDGIDDADRDHDSSLYN